MRIHTEAQKTQETVGSLNDTVNILNTTINSLNIVIYSLSTVLDSLKGTQDTVFSNDNGVIIKNIENVSDLYILEAHKNQLSIKADESYGFITSSNSAFISKNNLLLIYTTFDTSLEENGWYVFKYTSNSSDVSDFLLDLSSKILISVESDTRVYNTFPKSISVTYV